METENSPLALGLSAKEQANIEEAIAEFPSGWRIAFETTDHNETYVVLMPPGEHDWSGFLIDRERHGLIVTDNLSDEARPIMKVMPEICDAIDYAATVVRAHARFKAAIRN